MLGIDECLIIGEVAQAHDGSLGTAHAYIDAIADAGANAVKFQTHIASAESTPSEQWRIKFSQQDNTRYDYWKRMEFSEAQWLGLKEHADEKGLIFLSSPFSFQAIDLLERIGVPAWKVASGETGSKSMLLRMLDTGKPILLSTGMSPLSEVDATMAIIQNSRCEHAIFQCTSKYPCPAEDVGLNMILEYQQRYGCPVGLSDHSGTIFPSIVAAGLGAKFIEVHVAFNKKAFGPDNLSSVDVDELTVLVQGVRFAEKMLNHPVDKDAISDELQPMRSLFGKSITARVDIPQGAIIEESHLLSRKPGTGIAEEHIDKIIGKKSRNHIPADSLLSESDIEGFDK